VDTNIDIDGLHSTLESAPNDQEALGSLVEFYRSESAIEELTELYISQLENQTEHRLPLYQGLAEIMEQELELAEDARVVVRDGLEEFPTDDNLWDKFKRLSNDEAQLLEYITQLKATALSHDSEPLMSELIHLAGELSSDELVVLSNKVHDVAIAQGSATLALQLWSELNTQQTEDISTYLETLIDVAIELESPEILEQIGSRLAESSDDVFTQYVAAVQNLAIAHQKPELVALVTDRFDSLKEEWRAHCVGAMLDIAIELNHVPVLKKIQSHLSLLPSEGFTKYLSELSRRCKNEQSVELLAVLLDQFTEYPEDRKIEYLMALKEALIQQSDVHFMIELLPYLEQLAQAEQEAFRQALEGLLITALDPALFERLLEACDNWSADGFAHLMTEIYFTRSGGDTIRTQVEQWLLTIAPAEQLDAFINRFVSESDDFDAIALLMKQRGQACAARNESTDVQRHWQERALTLNPSSTGMFAYFEVPRTLDEQDLSFLANLVMHEQTDPRIGMQMALKAIALESLPSTQEGWIELLIDSYRRSQTYDADHQKAIEHLQAQDRLSTAAELLKESATIEKDEMIQRSLLLDAGDLMLTLDPKESARCYYKAFETKNDDRVILSKLLDAYQKSEEWAKSTKVLRKLASLAGEPMLKAKYLYAMGVIERDKLNDHTSAVRTFDKALDADPTLVKAIQAIDEVITDDQDFQRQDRYYRKCLARAIDHNVDGRVIFQLAQNLATLNISKLGNDEAAVKALLVARGHTTNIAEIDRQLLGIYRSKGELANALDLHYQELNVSPLQIRHYKELFVTLRAFGLNESAAMVQRTLHALGASDMPQMVKERNTRSSGIRHFTQQMWQMLTPANMNPVFAEVFQILAPSILNTYALADNAYSFSRPEPLGPSSIPPVFMAVASRLRLPLPMIWFSTESGAMAQVHRTTPALVLGPAIDQLSGPDQKFLATRMLFQAKVEFFLVTHPSPFAERVEHLTDLFNGCIQLTKTGRFERKDAPLIKRTLSSLDTKDVLGLTHILSDASLATKHDLAEWIRGVDYMASRLGLMLTDDVEVAIRLTRDISQSWSDLATSDKLTDLLRFSVSRDYLITCGDLSPRN
jgi:tetratricopeptide (TPR) repeat protein